MNCPDCKKPLVHVIVYREMKARYSISGEKIGDTEPSTDEIDVECGECKANVMTTFEKHGVDITPFAAFGE